MEKTIKIHQGKNTYELNIDEPLRIEMAHRRVVSERSVMGMPEVIFDILISSCEQGIVLHKKAPTPKCRDFSPPL